MKQRILSILVIFCMCMTILPQGAVTVSAAEIEEPVEYTGQEETGTYTISDESQLRTLAEKVNSGTGYDGTTFKLTEDIKLTKEWIPIAYDPGSEFNGIFDGGNHKIEGLTITSDDSPWEYCGLFGEVWVGTIQNLTVKGDIKSTVLNTGGIVGRADEAKIINCSYEGTIISGSRDFVYIGGIAAEAYGTKIINCRNKGYMEGSADARVGAGGIAGYATDESEIINCKNEGSVNAYAGSESLAGGIAGWTQMTVTITDCQNTGSISAQDSYAGGIVGRAQVVSGRDGVFSGKITAIENCLNENEVQDSSSWGEIVGEAERDEGVERITIKNCYYKSDSVKFVGNGTADVENVEEKSPEQFASGEVAYLLQNPEQGRSSDELQDSLVWGQNLGVDGFPGLVHFMEGDKAAKEVLKIKFYDANATGYTPTPYEMYINNGATIKAAYGFEQISSQEQYPDDKYETVGLSSEDGTGKIFREDTPITEDNTALYLFYKEKFSSEDDTITTPHGTTAEKDLDGQMKYAGGTSAAGNFTYEITDGNGDLKASLNGSTLTIPATADIGSYTLTIEATEKNPTVKNLQNQEGVTINSEDSVTFKVTVTVEKSDKEWIDEAVKVVQKALDEMNVTNETTKEDVQDVIDQALKEAGLEDVTAVVGDDFNVKKATEESEGQITGTVALEKGKENDSVGIDKKIDKLEQTLSPTPSTPPEQTPDSDDAQRLEAAKKVVQNVLDSMSATNDTTQEKIQEVIDEALKAAGFEDVTAAVGDDLTIEESTGDTKGKITGTVTLEKGEVKDTVDFELEIPEDKSKGTVDKGTQSGEGAPDVDLPMDTEELANAVFTDKERDEIDEGKDIKLLLTVDNIEEDKVSAEDAEKITEGASYYTLGRYLDINLLKTVSSNGVPEGEPTRITSTGKPIRVVIYIPDSLKGDGSRARSYAVVRLHDGETTLLEDLDDEEDTITIETDRFSTYAMVYTELTDEDRVEGAEEKLEEILKGLTATNDTTKEDIEEQIHDKLAEAGYGDVTVTVEITEREEATTEKEGSLKGNATISKGDASGQRMLWEATIDKVTATPPDTSPSVEPTATPPDASPSAEPTAEPQKTPGVTPSAAPTVTPSAMPTATPDGNADDDRYQKVGLIPELKVTPKGKKIQVEWGKAADADGYLVYVQYCGKKFAKKATKTIRNSSTTKVKIAKVGGKKLKLKKNFKVYVAAYKMMGGKQVVIKKTMTGHIVGKKNYKYTNAKKVKVTKSKISLRVGKIAKIKAKTVCVDKKKKLLPDGHGKKYRYRSMDDSIVTVSKSGKITAAGRGTCSVYVFAQNGCAKKIKVTAK